ncbi:hypothetical protein [Brevundimonas diminuta]|uniref:hypothetical protein n=1 Tax=Brevundimonas diminuta TaxID=293 RepID=UPI0025A61C7C|nr:hypothetical protein [Brevundimonas diminuta]MDM8352901.1 hypothetical protein [Brevundimonas diminuta]
MAVTTLGAALIGGGLFGATALSSSAAKKAGKQVAGATDQAAQLQNQQFERLLALQMPGYQRGEQAANLYSQLLGIPSMTGGSSGGYSGGAMTGGGEDWYGYLRDNPDVMQAIQRGGFGGPSDMEAAARWHYSEYGRNEGRALPGAGGGSGQQSQAPTQQQLYDQIKNTPGYQAQLDQGLKSIDRAAPLVGGMYSGRRMKALNDYGQNTFGSYYQNYMDRVAGVAGQGQQTARDVGQAGMQNANNVGGLMVQGANARAKGTMNSANAWSSAIGTGLGMYGGAKGWW